MRSNHVKTVHNKHIFIVSLLSFRTKKNIFRQFPQTFKQERIWKKKEFEWTGKVEIGEEKKILVLGEACMAIF